MSPLDFILLPLLLIIALGVAIVVRRRQFTRRELIGQVKELSSLADFARAIAEARLDVDELCELIYRRAAEIVDASFFQLGLFDGNWYDIRVWTREGTRLPAQRFDLHDSPGLIGWLRESHQPLLVRDFEQEIDRLPAKPRYATEVPPRSAVFLPLISGDRVIGALAVQSDRPSAFTENHLRLLTIIGNQSAAAIANRRFYELERRRTAQMQLITEVNQQIAGILDLEALFHQTVELVRATFDYYFVAICVREEDSNRIVFEGATDPALHNKPLHVGQGLIGWVVEHGELQNIPDVMLDDRYWPQATLVETRSELTVPLIFGGETIGALDVESNEVGAFSDDDIYILRTLADQIAIAIHEARLYAAEREQAWISTALLQVAEATGQATSLEEVLDTVTRITPMLSGVDRCGIMLQNGSEGTFHAQASFGIDPHTAEFSALELTPDQSPMLHALYETAKPIMRPAKIEIDPICKYFGPGDVLGLPIMARGELIGVMWIGASPGQFLSGRKAALIGGIANQAAMAIESAQLAVAQREEAWVSTALLQVAEAAGSLTDLDEILKTIVRLTPLLVGVEVCALFLWHADRQVFAGSHAYGLPREALDEFGSIKIAWDEWPMTDTDRAEFGHALPFAPDRLVQALRLDQPIVLPLRARAEIVGALVVDRGTRDLMLNQRRLNILTGIASQTAVAIENVHLMADLAARQLLEKELDVAREIQKSFLPGRAPNVPGFQIASYWRSARRVGGDFYDFMPLANHQVGLAIADVADKGVPAALFMALSRTLLRATAMSGRTPADTLSRANELIMSDARSDLFVTIFYGVLDPKSAKFTYANAGHNPPIWYEARSNTTRFMKEHGIALGVVPEVLVKDHVLTLAPGDVLVLYTDGVTEAFNAAGDEFGDRHLAQVVRECAAGTAEEISQAIVSAVRAFVGDEPPFDDVTMVVVKRDE
jgi:serine phosphatase RsbU (regulator of sigma subunit)/putative methionine-R-sulfoxide reductase with GAF domain